MKACLANGGAEFDQVQIEGLAELEALISVEGLSEPMVRLI